MAATPPIKMPRRLTDILLLAIVAMTFYGCRLKRPDDVLSPKKMESVLYDYHMAQALVSELPKEEGPCRHAVFQDDLDIAQVHGVIEHGDHQAQDQADQQQPARQIPYASA